MSRESIERNKRFRILGILVIGAGALVYVALRAVFGG